MNPVPENNDWLDEVERRRLPADEVERLRHELAARPRETARLEEELRLNALLDGGPRPAPSSNFTSRVLAAIEAEEARTARESAGLLGWLRVLRLPRLAAFATVLVAAGVAWWQFQLYQRGTLAHQVSEVSQLAAVPGVETLRDFDAIQLLRVAAQPDDLKLVAALDE